MLLASQREGVQEARGEDGPHLDLVIPRELGEEVDPAAKRVAGDRREVDGSQHTPRWYPQLAPHQEHGTDSLPRDTVRSGAQ